MLKSFRRALQSISGVDTCHITDAEYDRARANWNILFKCLSDMHAQFTEYHESMKVMCRTSVGAMESIALLFPQPSLYVLGMEPHQAAASHATSLPILSASSSAMTSHPYSTLAHTSKARMALLLNDRLDSCSRRLVATCMAQVSELLTKFNDLKKRVQERDETIHELEYYVNKTMELSRARINLVSAGKKESQKDEERRLRSEENAARFRTKYDELNQYLVGELSAYWDRRLDLITPIMLDFHTAQSRFIQELRECADEITRTRDNTMKTTPPIDFSAVLYEIMNANEHSLSASSSGSVSRRTTANSSFDGTLPASGSSAGLATTQLVRHHSSSSSSSINTTGGSDRGDSSTPTPPAVVASHSGSNLNPSQPSSNATSPSSTTSAPSNAPPLPARSAATVAAIAAHAHHSSIDHHPQHSPKHQPQPQPHPTTLLSLSTIASTFPGAAAPNTPSPLASPMSPPIPARPARPGSTAATAKNIGSSKTGSSNPTPVDSPAPAAVANATTTGDVASATTVSNSATASSSSSSSSSPPSAVRSPPIPLRVVTSSTLAQQHPSLHTTDSIHSSNINSAISSTTASPHHLRSATTSDPPLPQHRIAAEQHVNANASAVPSSTVFASSQLPHPHPHPHPAPSPHTPHHHYSASASLPPTARLTFGSSFAAMHRSTAEQIKRASMVIPQQIVETLKEEEEQQRKKDAFNQMMETTPQQ